MRYKGERVRHNRAKVLSRLRPISKWNVTSKNNNIYVGQWEIIKLEL